MSGRYADEEATIVVLHTFTKSNFSQRARADLAHPSPARPKVQVNTIAEGWAQRSPLRTLLKTSDPNVLLLETNMIAAPQPPPPSFLSLGLLSHQETLD